MAISTCTVTGNVKNLIANNVSTCQIKVYVPAPFFHASGPSWISGELATVTTDTSGNFSVTLIETTTPGQYVTFEFDYYDGVANRKAKKYQVIIPNTTTARLIDLVAANTPPATTGSFPAANVSLVPISGLTALNAQDAFSEILGDEGTTQAQLDAHIAASAVHGATGAVVGTTNTQTLTNKTLTAPVINSPTGIVKSDVGLGNVDNTSDATKNAASATLTNKTISGAANTITNVNLTTGVTGTLPVANGGTGVTTSTGSGNTVLSTSPTLVTPALGTPTALVGTNITGTAAGLTAGTVTTNANLTGDVTSVGNATTLATVNSNVGSFGSSTSIPTLTVTAKGLVTAASGNAVIAPAGTLTGATLASGVTASSLTSVGTIATGTWNGTTIAIANGGTGQTTAAAAFNALSPMTTLGDIEYESAANTASRLAGNTTSTKKFLTQTGTGTVSAAPTWGTLAGSDLPNPSSSTLGGIQSYAAVSNQWINAISTSGVPSSTQPAFSNISGTASLTTQVTGALPLVNGGTGTAAASANAAFNALSPLTTKGDVLTYSTVNARLGVGTDGQVLSSDSTQTTGLKWIAAGGTGTVTSVTFTGDGTVLSSTPSSAVTTSGTLTAAIKTQTARTFLQGPLSGSAAAPTFAALTAPTIQKFTSGSGTYTTPTSPAPLYIRVRMVGGGGGGSGSGSAPVSGTNAGNGGNSTFGSSLLVANGGVGGDTSNTGNGGTGGTASLGTGPIGTAFSGGTGQGNAFSALQSSVAGGSGAATPFGGEGGGGCGENPTAGAAAIANTGSGGGGGGTNGGAGGATRYSGSGGGAGGFVDAIITSPSATYAYAVGAAGTAGSPATNGTAGGAGGSGYIEVTEIYQ